MTEAKTKKVATKKRAAAKKKPERLSLNLALQGGGAHGAYTWGVLDRLLDEEDIDIAGISGTSAGALNGVLLVNGFMQGGRARAKELLRQFWMEVSGQTHVFAPFDEGVSDHWEQWQSMFRPDFAMALGAMELVSKAFSPYDLNPMNINPLRDILERTLHLDLLDDRGPIKLFITATAVETGQPHVFSCSDISVDVLLASACLPNMFQAVMVEGEAYWDGGYVGNPSIWPLIYHTDCQDVLLVEINPIYRPGIPKTGTDILNRINEISFNSSLISEMRAINFVKKLIARGALKGDGYKDINMHIMGTPELLEELSASTKLYADWKFFNDLHDAGYGAATRWLKAHKKDIGTRSSMDIEGMFLSNKYALSMRKKSAV